MSKPPKLPPPAVREQTFANFVRRAGNRVTYEYLRRLAARRPTAGTTILCGASGTGKSHLLRATLRRWQGRDATLLAETVSATDLLRTRILPEVERGRPLRRMPRPYVDVLIVEHLESLASQPRSLEEVLQHCADAATSGARVIISISAPVVRGRIPRLGRVAARALQNCRVLRLSAVGPRINRDLVAQ